MDQATLVGPDLNAIQDALNALDKAALGAAVSLLAIFPEYGDWRLVIASPLLDQKHLLKAHTRVAQLFAGRFVYTLPPLMILPMKDPFIRELRRLFGKATNVRGMRLGGQTIGDRYLEAGYVFRIQ